MKKERSEEMVHITSKVQSYIKDVIGIGNDSTLSNNLDFHFLFNERLSLDKWLRPYVCAVVLKHFNCLYKDEVNRQIEEGVLPALVAAEVFNISTYQSNIVFDDKINNKTVSDVNQIISSFISLSLATDLLSKLQISEQRRLECILKLNKNNRAVYEGQFIDLNLLVVDNIDSIIRMNYEEYLEVYLNRCDLIGGTTVENCAYWAYKIAGKTDDVYLKRLCRAFRVWGQLMQMVNDLSDFTVFFDNGYKRYNDVRAGKVTLPFYLILKEIGKDKAYDIVKNVPFQSINHLDNIFSRYLYKDSKIVKEILYLMKERWSICSVLMKELDLDMKMFSFMYENAFLTKYSRFFFSNKLINSKNGANNNRPLY